MEGHIGDIFQIDAPPIKIQVRDGDHPMIPKEDAGYVFRKDILSDVLAWSKGAAGNDPLYLSGPTGSGKSSLVTQIAARLRIPLYVVSCHERMEITELFGRFVVRSGNMEWVDGPFIQGLKDPASAWILLDEADTLDPGTFVGLNALIEGRSIMIPETGEIIDPLRCGARVICAGNTAGHGDTTGLYQSTKRQNLSSMGRFMMVEVGYPSATEENLVLEKAVPEIPEAVRRKMIEVANKVRDLFQSGEIEVTVCTRSLIRWAHMAVFYKGKPGVNLMSFTLDRALGYRAEVTSRQALHELLQRIIGG